MRKVIDVKCPACHPGAIKLLTGGAIGPLSNWPRH
jgi:hypothetical protein